jgi:hypothetical protein
MMPKSGRLPGRDHAQNQRDWRAIRANSRKSRSNVAFAMADARREKGFGEPLRSQMGFDESLPARKSRLEHDPEKLQTFSDKIMLEIKGFRALADST